VLGCGTVPGHTRSNLFVFAGLHIRAGGYGFKLPLEMLFVKKHYINIYFVNFTVL
jgi:hypothetical protein